MEIIKEKKPMEKEEESNQNLKSIAIRARCWKFVSEFIELINFLVVRLIQTVQLFWLFHLNWLNMLGKIVAKWW